MTALPHGPELALWFSRLGIRKLSVHHPLGFSVFLYLGNILVLHITTPGLFSLETFNSTSLSVVPTQGLPAIASYNITSNDTYDMYVNCILLPDLHQFIRAASRLFHPMHTDHFITSPTSKEV
jgi:hypothetical protein